MNNQMNKSAILTCGPRLCEIDDFLYCFKYGFFKYRIHLGKTDRDNLKIIKNLICLETQLNQKLDIYIDIPTTRPRLGDNLTNADKVIVPKGERFNIIYKRNSDWKNHLNDLSNNILISRFNEYKNKIKKNSKIALKDGSYFGIIKEMNEYGMEVECLTDVKLYSSESILFPNIQIEYNLIDDEIISFFTRLKCEKITVDKFIISFCHSRESILNMRKFLNEFFQNKVHIMAKIEDALGVKNFDVIGMEADSILIGRGDLGPDIGFEKLPKAQKEIVKMARKIKTPIYVGTQFLEELVQQKRLYPPELNDIYMAISQEADGIMLSGEVGGSPNSRSSIKVMYEMLKKYKNEEDNMLNNNESKESTQILATMGPTLQTTDDVIHMIKSNVLQYRIHMGLRNRDFCGYFRNAMIASKYLGKKINILLDLPSTRPRVTEMREYMYSENEKAYIYDSDLQIEINKDYMNIPLPHFSELVQSINIGEHIMFRDGHVIFEVKEKQEHSILVQCKKSDLVIKTGASSCFPESPVIFRPLDSTDIFYLKRMKEQGLKPDRVAISFASTVEQIDQVKACIQEIWSDQEIDIICKIESKLGLKNIDLLLQNSDGIMIARGDLLLCIDPYELPRIQMELSRKCKEAGKILIIATEFFERYAETGIVNRSELSDVALAVRQGADSIMLARETGNSQYSQGCVDLINAIIANEKE